MPRCIRTDECTTVLAIERVEFMPQRKSNETALRLLLLVEIIKAASKQNPITRKQICDALQERGFNISEEQVGEDIRALIKNKDVFLPLEGIRVQTRTKPYTYWYAKGVQDIVEVSPQLAFALKLMERYLGEFIPTPEKAELNLLLQRAGDILTRAGNKRYARLLSRFEIHPRGYQLIPPPVDEKMLQEILEAIAGNKLLSFSYQGKGKKSKKRTLCAPLGIVDRSGILTLVAMEHLSGETRNYNLSRISELSWGSDFAYPKDFRLGEFVAAGNMNRSFYPREIEVHLRLDRRECADLLESKLSADQRVVYEDEQCFEIKATVPHSIELVWWLRERWPHCAVLAPEHLCERMHNERIQTDVVQKDREVS